MNKSNTISMILKQCRYAMVAVLASIGFGLLHYVLSMSMLQTHFGVVADAMLLYLGVSLALSVIVAGLAGVNIALIIYKIKGARTGIRKSGGSTVAGSAFAVFTPGCPACTTPLAVILAQRMDVPNIVQIKSAIGGVLLFVIALLVFRVDLSIDANQIVPILVLGSVGFAASLYFFLQGLKRIGTVRTITIFSMSSVFGLVAASVFLAEQISLYHVVAAGIMILGIYLVSRKESIDVGK